MKKRKYDVESTIGIHTILEIYPKYNGTKTTYCKIDCPCGEAHIVHYYHLINSGKAICNCEATGYYYNKRNDNELIGKTFGELTIIEVVRDAGSSQAYVVCTCSCKNEIIALKNNVLKGNTTSCGCMQMNIAKEIFIKDWTGIVSDYGVEFLKQGNRGRNEVFKWVCKCPLCGNTFEAYPHVVMSGKNKSCGCLKKSWGEDFIERYLISRNIRFQREHIIKSCRNEDGDKPLRFDFSIFDEDDNPICLIEYDGLHHETPVDFFGGQKKFEILKSNDNIKNKYCQENLIPLYRINHTYSAQEIEQTIDYILSNLGLTLNESN